MLKRVLVLTDGTADAEFRATGLLDALNLQLAVELQVREGIIDAGQLGLCATGAEALGKGAEVVAELFALYWTLLFEAAVQKVHFQRRRGAGERAEF